MMTLRPAHERGHFRNQWLDSYHTFSFGSYYDPEHLQFGTLRVINHDTVEASQGFDFHGHKDMEIFTYVLSGTLEHQDSMGNKEKIRAGEVQIMSAGTGILHSEYNASDSAKVEFLQIWVMPEKYGVQPRYQQKEYSTQEKLNQFKLIISPNGENGSLQINQKAWVWASVFEKNVQKTFKAQNGKNLWLHIAKGEIEVNGQQLKKGDGLRIDDQSSFNVKGLAPEAEFVMMELA
jgi:redox-sensitive bicupin YhaK (pirin superfamily)